MMMMMIMMMMTMMMMVMMMMMITMWVPDFGYDDRNNDVNQCNNTAAKSAEQFNSNANKRLNVICGYLENAECRFLLVHMDTV